MRPQPGGQTSLPPARALIFPPRGGHVETEGPGTPPGRVGSQCGLAGSLCSRDTLGPPDACHSVVHLNAIFPAAES